MIVPSISMDSSFAKVACSLLMKIWARMMHQHGSGVKVCRHSYPILGYYLGFNSDFDDFWYVFIANVGVLSFKIQVCDFCGRRVSRRKIQAPVQKNPPRDAPPTMMPGNVHDLRAPLNSRVPLRFRVAGFNAQSSTFSLRADAIAVAETVHTAGNGFCRTFCRILLSSSPDRDAAGLFPLLS